MRPASKMTCSSGAQPSARNNKRDVGSVLGHLRVEEASMQDTAMRTSLACHQWLKPRWSPFELNAAHVVVKLWHILQGCTLSASSLANAEALARRFATCLASRPLSRSRTGFKGRP